MSHKITFEYIVEALDPEKVDIIDFQQTLEELQTEVEIKLDRHFSVSHSLFEITEVVTRL